MAMADDDHGDPEEISVRLEWPVDPLVARPIEVEQDPLTRLEARLAALEERAPTDGGAMSREVSAAIEDVSTRLDYFSTELIEAVRNMNETFRLAIDDTTEAMRQMNETLRLATDDTTEAMRQMNDTLSQAIQENTAAVDDRVTGLRTAMMSMLASRQADEQRTQRRDREVLVAKIEQDMTAISRALTEAIAAARTQSDVFADRVAAELQALRRRIPVKGRDAAPVIDDRTIDDIVTRVADEVEIRMAAAVKPKPLRKRS